VENADHKSGLWLPDYYRVVTILVEFMGRELVEFLGNSGAAEALETNVREDQRITSLVIKRIATCKQSVAALTAAELEARRKNAEPKRSWAVGEAGLWTKSHLCPACGSKGGLTLKHLSDRPAEIVDSSIYVDSIYSPRSFDCGVCGLTVAGIPELRVAGLADQIVDSTENDPAEYFDIDLSPSRDDDYGNE
jgi:hypothetical protein